MANNEINTKGIINSIDSFNENSQKICASLNGLETSLNEFNKSISKLDDLKEIDLTKKKIDELKLASKSEQDGVKSMLSAAAFTYVASVLESLFQLLRLVLRFRDREDR